MACQAVHGSLSFRGAKIAKSKREGIHRQPQLSRGNQTNQGVLMTMKKYLQARCALALNLAGALLLLFAFSATSTNLLLVTDATKSQVAFCIGDRAVFGVEGTSTRMGYKCPNGLDAKPTAVVNSD